MSFFDFWVLAGREGVGKAEFGRIVEEECSMLHISSGQLVREEMQRAHIPRPEEGGHADTQRRLHGSDHYVRVALERAARRPLVVDGLRAPGEILAAINEYGALIAWIDGPDHKRHQASLRPGRVPTTPAQFREQGRIEFDPGTDDPNTRNLRFVRDHAHLKIWNPYEREPARLTIKQIRHDLHNGDLSEPPYPKIYGDYPSDFDLASD